MLKVKIVQHGGDRNVLLCTEDGEPLPNQKAVALEQAIGEPKLLTVTFLIDGRHIGFE